MPLSACYCGETSYPPCPSGTCPNVPDPLPLAERLTAFADQYPMHYAGPLLREAAAALEAREADETHKAIDRLLAFCLSDNEPQSRYKFSFGIEYSCIVDFVVDLTPRAHHPLARQYPAYQTQSGNFAKAVNAAIDAAIDGLPASAPGVAPRLPDGEPRLRVPTHPLCGRCGGTAIPAFPSAEIGAAFGRVCALCLWDIARQKTATVPEVTQKHLEALADYAHEAWSGWMCYLFKKSTFNAGGTVTIPKWAVERWVRQSTTSYAELPEAEKESDRDEARKMLAIVGLALGTAEDGSGSAREASEVPQDQGATQNPERGPNA